MMAEINLTQAEADALLAMAKQRADEKRYDIPARGQWLSVALQSTDGREKFLLDLSRGRIHLRKFTMQQRARQVVILARLDLAGAPHRNPDGEEIPTPHLHIYREGFGAKWAIPLPAAHFSPGADEWQKLAEFMRYCHIIEPPNFQRRLLA